jgi:hypothetical protein
MEKTFQLDQKELAMIAQADQERTQALAQVGALSLDMEQARKNLDAAAERQRYFIRQIVMNRGVERFESARVQNGAIVVTVPEAGATAPAAEASPRPVERVNGPFLGAKE